MDEQHPTHNLEFSGNIFIFQAFDIGDDINLEGIKKDQTIHMVPFQQSKYFKNYHTPLAIELPHPHTTSKCFSSTVHNFGVVSLAYKIPFTETLQGLRERLTTIDSECLEYSVGDAQSIFKKIKRHIKQPKFFHLRTSYVVIQVDKQSDNLSLEKLKKEYGGVIGSLLRFETESLSEYQKNAILEDSFGYYRGDLYIVDVEASFVYDDEYEDLLDIFEFANIQRLELQYFDRTLDQQLNAVYQRDVRQLPLKAYLPFGSAFGKDPITSLGMLKVEISVITERLNSSIKLAGESNISDLYDLLVEKLDLRTWKDGIHNKLDIIKDLNSIYQDKVDVIRENVLSVLVIVLIFIELIVGILSYFK